jgi:signal transduction histidine kinase
LRIGTALQPDGAARVSVADSGVGLQPEHLERLFEPFFTTKPSGMGMGLAISQTVVEAHGGKLWAANNPEGGATFFFTVAFADSAQG